jgi:hypothetical protein
MGGRVLCRTCVGEGRVRTYSVPWEHRAELGFWTALWSTIKGISGRPSTFFRGVDPGGSLREAWLFASAALAVPVVVWAALLGLILGGMATYEVAASSGRALPDEFLISSAVVLLGAVLIPIVVPLFFCIGALVHHVLLLLSGGGKAGLTATLRACLYAFGGVYFWLIVPCMYYVAGIWLAVVQIYGYTSVHQDRAWRAALAVIGPIVLCVGAYATIVAGALLAESDFLKDLSNP